MKVTTKTKCLFHSRLATGFIEFPNNYKRRPNKERREITIFLAMGALIFLACLSSSSRMSKDGVYPESVSQNLTFNRLEQETETR